MSVFQILEELAATSSRLEKIAILRQNAENAVLQAVIKLALCPYTQFYIRKIPEYSAGNEELAGLEWAVGALRPLADRQVTGHAARDYLKAILSSIPTNEARVIERIIAKDLACGVQASTANKVWPKLVPTYPCMLAETPTEKLLAKIKFPAQVQLKSDGMRGNVICAAGKEPEIRSRSGNVIDLLGIFEQEFSFANTYDCVYDGELVMVDEDGNLLPRKTSNGMLTKAQRGTFTEEMARRVKMLVWDRIDYTCFQAGYDPMPYEDRLQQLRADFQLANLNKLMVIGYIEVRNLEEASMAADVYMAEGHEGGILKNMDAPWEDKRSQNQLKFKAEKECDLLCTAIRPGTKKNLGKIGALECESSDGIVKVGVGTGLNDEDRAEDPKKYLGKIISIVYNERIMDKTTGQHSLFLPRFIEVREDKTEADPSERIK